MNTASGGRRWDNLLACVGAAPGCSAALAEQHAQRTERSGRATTASLERGRASRVRDAVRRARASIGPSVGANARQAPFRPRSQANRTRRGFW